MLDFGDIGGAGGTPKYRRLAQRIADAIHAGTLAPGARLPSHRDLAYQLGISVASVSRAYAELAAERLVRCEVGRGTLVQPLGQGSIRLEREPEIIDLGLVTRPPIDDESLLDAAGRKTMRTLGNQWSLLDLGAFAPERGESRHRRAAAGWLSARGVPASDSTVAIAIGAQEALSSSLATFARRGDAVLVESVTVSAMRDLAHTLGLELCPVEMDDEGMLPDDLVRAARRRRAGVVMVQPTLQIPTTASMSEGRRRDIARAARECDLVLLEYEGWSAVADVGGPPVAALAPERVIYIDGFSNTLMPGLRASIVRAPEPLMSRLVDTRHAMVLSTPRLISEVVTHWIANGIAGDLASAVRAANERRLRIARRVLRREAPPGRHPTPFLWLATDDPDGADGFARTCEGVGVRVLPASQFAVSPRSPQRVRVALSSPSADAELERGLRKVARLL